MNIKTKLTLNIGALVAMIVLLVSLSVVNLQILTAIEPTSPAADSGLQRALVWVSIIGGLCIVCGLWMLKQLPWEPSACWKPSAFWAWKRNAASTRLPRPSFRAGAGSPPEGNHAVLSPFTLRRSQAIRILDYQELPGILQYVCR